MGTWKNNDGLYIKYGTDAGVSNSRAGEYEMDGPDSCIVLEIELSELTQTETILNDAVVIPTGAQITRIEVITEVAAATGVAVDLGLIKISDRSTEIDYDGLLAAFPTAQMNTLGETVIFYPQTTIPASSTGTGALMGTVTTLAGHLSASCTTATLFTAGRIAVRIYFRPSALLTN